MLKQTTHCNARQESYQITSHDNCTLFAICDDHPCNIKGAALHAHVHGYVHAHVHIHVQVHVLVAGLGDLLGAGHPPSRGRWHMYVTVSVLISHKAYVSMISKVEMSYFSCSSLFVLETSPFSVFVFKFVLGSLVSYVGSLIG